MTTTEQRQIAENKVRNYTVMSCVYGIQDCHDTLKVGQYAYDHPYARKLWAEIDAMRSRMRQITGH